MPPAVEHTAFTVERRHIASAACASQEVERAAVAPSKDTERTLASAPGRPEAWAAFVSALDVVDGERLRDLLGRFPMAITERTVGGVTVRHLTPRARVQTANKLIHLHGGAFVAGRGEAGLREAVLMAHRSSLPVISIDYRMPPEHPFPAALDDVVAVWRALLVDNPPGRFAMFGTSAGAALLVSAAVKFKELGLALPAALAASTPWSDLAQKGDSYFINQGIDSAVPRYAGLLERAARLYAGDRALDDPLISPVYADLAGLPPTIITTGTRDLFLSCSVRLHRALRNVGVPADLHVFEGIAHGQLIGLFESPESLAASAETIAFLLRHFGG